MRLSSGLRSCLRKLFPILSVAVVITLGFDQTGSAEEPEPSPDTNDTPFQFLSQTGFVPANGDYTLSFSGPGDDPIANSAMVDITFFTALEKASPLAPEPEDLFNRLPIQSVSALVNDSNEIELTIPIRNSSDGDADRLLLPDPGVYPVVVEFRVGEEILQSVRTNLIRLPIDEPEPEGAGETQPAPPSELPAVSIGIDATQTGFTLSEVRDLVISAGELPVAVVVDQSTIERLQAGGPEAEAFISGTKQLQLVPSPGAGADISTLASIGQAKLHHERLQRLRSDAQLLGLSVSTEISVVSSPLTTPGLAALEASNVSTALDVGPSQAASEDATSDLGVFLSSTPAITVVPTYQPPTNGADTPLWVHQLASSITIDQRLSGGESTFIYLNPQVAGDFGPEQLQVIASGNNTAFTIEPVGSTASDVKVLEPVAAPPIDVTEHQATIESIVSQIDTYETTYVDGERTPAIFRNNLIAVFEPSQTAPDRGQQFEQLSQDLRDEIQTLNLPSGQAVIVAAETVPVPLTIENNSDGSRQVLLTVESDKVDIKQDRQVLTIPPGRSFIDVDVEVRSLGVSPVQISLFTPDGKNRLASTRFEVRSTAIPGLGLLLCLLGAVLLAFWWYVHAKRRRKRTHDTQGGDIDGAKANDETVSTATTTVNSPNDGPIENKRRVTANDHSGGKLT